MGRKEELELKSIEETSDLWQILTPDQIEYLKGNYRVQRYRKNEIVYHEGETPTHALCLIKGKIKIFKNGVGGRIQIVRIIKPFEMFGYRAMFAGENFVTAASAFEQSIIYAIPKEVIKYLIMKNSQLAWHFIRVLSVDLGIADARSVSLTQKHVRGRLAESLLFLKERYGVEADGATISVYLSREDLANLSNMTTSNAIRTLSNFANEKLIAMDGRKIKIMDEDRLRKINKIG